MELDLVVNDAARHDTLSLSLLITVGLCTRHIGSNKKTDVLHRCFLVINNMMQPTQVEKIDASTSREKTSQIFFHVFLLEWTMEPAHVRKAEFFDDSETTFWLTPGNFLHC